MSDINTLKKTVDKQGRQIDFLTRKVESIQRRLNMKDSDASADNFIDAKPEPESILEHGIKSVKEKVRTISSKSQAAKESISESYNSAELENPTNMFRVFGFIGVFMIILGIVYFYRYAVDNGWIGITGRIALGVIVSLSTVILGLLFNNKGYKKFSPFIIAGGLGMLYFTIYATYHFREYRNALGMDLTLNSILLMVVMIGGLALGLRLNSKFVTYASLILGFVAAFLSGISGNTLHILIYVLLIDLIILFLAVTKNWFLAIPAQIMTFIAYGIWYGQAIYSPQSVLNQTTSPVFMTFFFLLVYFGIFTLISLKQSSTFKNTEYYALSLINTIALTAFGLGVVDKYVSEFNGMYLMCVAGLTLLIGFMSKKFNLEKMLELHFLYTLILVALAIPVQFDNTIVTVLWVLMALGLTYAGIQTGRSKLFYVGYLGYIIPMARVLFYDLWFLNNTAERVLAVGAGIGGLIIMQLMIKTEDRGAVKDVLFNLYTLIGIFLSTIWIAAEIEYTDFSRSMTNMSLSIAWAVFAIILIMYGVSDKRKLFNWSGLLLFGIVVFKVLLIDLSSMQNIFRVFALIIVGILSLVGSFVFVRNKDKIKEFV